MARNGSGTYTLPLSAVVTATTITSAWANTTTDDIETELTDSLSRSGKGGLSASIPSDVGCTGTVNPEGDTSAGDNSALGYTSVDGAILTGQGSTNDVTIKNDADAIAMRVPTGTINPVFPGAVTVTGGVTGDVTGDVTGNSDTVTTNANLTGDVTSVGNATTLTVDAITGQTALTSGLASTDELLVNDGGVIKRMDISVLEDFFYPAQATGHIRAGNTQILDGNTATTAFDLDANITESTFETVGPTGSGATNILSDMDEIPSTGTIVMFDCYIELISSGASPAELAVYACKGDVSPSVNQERNTVARFVNDPGVSGQEYKTWTRVFIPLDSSQIFKLTWTMNNETGGSGIKFYYRGFMTD